jgi:hypothetical protein
MNILTTRVTTIQKVFGPAVPVKMFFLVEKKLYKKKEGKMKKGAGINVFDLHRHYTQLALCPQVVMDFLGSVPST